MTQEAMFVIRPKASVVNVAEMDDVNLALAEFRQHIIVPHRPGKGNSIGYTAAPITDQKHARVRIERGGRRRVVRERRRPFPALDRLGLKNEDPTWIPP